MADFEAGSTEWPVRQAPGRRAARVAGVGAGRERDRSGAAAVRDLLLAGDRADGPPRTRPPGCARAGVRARRARRVVGLLPHPPARADLPRGALRGRPARPGAAGRGRSGLEHRALDPLLPAALSGRGDLRRRAGPDGVRPPAAQRRRARWRDRAPGGGGRPRGHRDLLERARTPSPPPCFRPTTPSNRSRCRWRRSSGCSPTSASTASTCSSSSSRARSSRRCVRSTSGASTRSPARSPWPRTGSAQRPRSGRCWRISTSS